MITFCVPALAIIEDRVLSSRLIYFLVSKITVEITAGAQNEF
jgi:hypothetical protein